MGEIMQSHRTGLFLLLIAAFAVPANASPIADAAEQQNWASVRTLAQKNPDIDATQADGTSALLWAAHHDNAELVGVLLDHGANANVKNRYGVFPLAEAALNGNAAIAERLMAAGADANAVLTGGDTALMAASRSGSAPIVKLLLAHGAQVDARETWHGETALMWAAGENHAEVVRLLAAGGADLNAVSTNFDWKDIKHGGVQSQLPAGGLTPLMHAARQNSYEAAVALVELGANPNLKDPMGISPLRIAISNGHLDLASQLLAHGADPNEGAMVEAVKVRTTPMMRAANNRTNQHTPLDLINELFARGAKPDSVASVAMPKKDAFEAGSVAGVSPSETGLFLAAVAQDTDLMTVMLEHGADVNRATAKGATVLMAATGGTIKRTANGASLSPPRPLELRLKAASLALNRGANVNAVDGTGATVLHAVAGQGEDELVKFLVAKGAKLDIKDKSNRTALDVANAINTVLPLGAPPRIPDPRVDPVVLPSTVALLRNLMAEAHVREVPYSLPPVVQTAAVDTPAPAAAASPAGAARQKPVTAIIGRE